MQTVYILGLLWGAPMAAEFQTKSGVFFIAINLEWELKARTVLFKEPIERRQ